MDRLVLPVMPEAVRAVFVRYPCVARAKLHEVRQILFEEAARFDVGLLQQTLKWGELAYLSSESKAGRTFRMAWKKEKPNTCALER